MKIELHILQNFAPSNLNRDDTGAPKDCELGGYRRARISSQCLKRAVRDAFTTEGMFAADDLAVRTKRVVHNVADELSARHHRDHEQSQAVVAATLAGAGLKTKPADEDYKTEYLLFLPKRQLAELAQLVDRHWDVLSALVSASGQSPDKAPEAKARSKKKDKSDKKGAFPKDIEKELTPILWAAKATADLALFGRMIADDPSYNVDAACQVAHAISTNRVSMDFDFYTAVDDLRPDDTAGSEMMGTVQFNSSCFYRYSVLDIVDLRRNLGADADLVDKTVAAYVRASVQAIPTGKQNSMAAHNPPSFVLAVVRPTGFPVSLANAFANPVRPSGDSDLIDGSVSALQKYLQSLSGMYGCAAVSGDYIADRDIATAEGTLPLTRQPSLEALVQVIQARIAAGPRP